MCAKSFICIPNLCMLEAKRAAAPLRKAARLWSAISLLCFNMGFQLFHSISPLSFFRALFLSYLAFSSLSPNNLFYLLSPTITPFLIIVSILFLCFFFSLDGGPGAPALRWGFLFQPQHSADTSELEHRLLCVGSVSAPLQKRLAILSDEHFISALQEHT